MSNAVLEEWGYLIAAARGVTSPTLDVRAGDKWWDSRDATPTMTIALVDEIKRQDDEIAALKARLDAQTDKVALAEAVEGMEWGGTLRRMATDGEWTAYDLAWIEEWHLYAEGDTPLAAFQSLKTKMEA